MDGKKDGVRYVDVDTTLLTKAKGEQFLLPVDCGAEHCAW